MDYRILNVQIEKDRYPIPNIREITDRTEGVKYFIKIDLREVFYSIRIVPGEEWKIVFRIRYGLFEFLVILIRQTNLPAT